jgi:hypothetical protein
MLPSTAPPGYGEALCAALRRGAGMASRAGDMRSFGSVWQEIKSEIAKSLPSSTPGIPVALN